MTENSFNCLKCFKSFASNRGMKIHMSVHKRNKSDSEPGSSKAKSSGTTASQHYKCPNCPKMFSRYKAFQCHLCSHINLFDYECNNCLKSFKSESLLNSHKEKDHLGKLYCCALCDKTFYKHLALQHHRTEHMYQSPYNCPLCGTSFSTISERVRHIKHHIYKCAICRVPIKSREEYLRHKTQVHGEIDDVSIPDSTSEEEMSENEENAMEDLGASKYSRNRPNSGAKDGFSPLNKKPCIICFICNKKILIKCLDFHMKSHDIYQCSDCLKYFSCEIKFKKHKRKHVKEYWPINPPSQRRDEAAIPIIPALITNDNLINTVGQPVNESLQISPIQPRDEADMPIIPSLITNDNLINTDGQIANYKETTKSGMNMSNFMDLKIDATVPCESGIIGWYMDIEKKCKMIGYPISEELCQSIQQTVKELKSQLQNDLLPEKRGIYVQIMNGLKNILIKNVIEQCT